MLKKINGDITKLPFHVDAIVNSAHPSLMAGGGVCGAIHEAAGEDLENECDMLLFNLNKKECGVGEALATNAYRLKADYVIHTVAVNIGKGGVPTFYTVAQMVDAYTNCLKVAEQLGCKSVAFPLLGAGIYGWETETALKIAEDVLSKSDLDVTLVLYK